MNGKHYTMYEATQHQRQIERAIRRQKWRIAADEGAGDSEKLQEDKTRLTQLRREYRDFSNAAGLRQQNDRLFTATGSGKGAASTLTSQPNGGMIEKTTPPEEKPDVHTVGHIDREIYKCVTEDIQTDEVIITDERIAHIEEHHPGEYEKVRPYLERVLKDPDYILEDVKNPTNTGLLLKHFTESDQRVQVILRLLTSRDKKGLKNSILSAWTISEKRWKNYEDNKKILYKKV